MGATFLGQMKSKQGLDRSIIRKSTNLKAEALLMTFKCETTIYYSMSCFFAHNNQLNECAVSNSKTHFQI